jgi:hypothetical protein
MNKMDLIPEIIDEFSKEIAGERELLTNLLYIVGGRWVKNKNPLSFHTILNSESGSGKDFIISRIIKLFDYGEDYEEYTRISPRALDYLHSNNQNFSWNNKFLLLHDVDDEILNSSTMKLFLTEGSQTAIVDKGIVLVKKVNGRPIVLMTTAYSDPNIEQLRRVNIMNLDESPDQTKKILQLQAQRSLQSHSIDTKINYEKLKKIVSKNKEVLVKIPF